MAGSSIGASACSLLLLFFLFGFSAAKEILVGGKTDAWKVPSSESDSLNKWAQRARFQVGDHLVWKYEGGKDSVLEVTKEDYAKCNISNPIKEHNDGNTKVQLDHPGPFYFISGAKDHCEKGEKLIVVVLSPRGGRSRSTGGVSAPAPAPVPAEFDGPAVAPSPVSSATALQGGLVVMGLGVLAMWVF